MERKFIKYNMKFDFFIFFFMSKMNNRSKEFINERYLGMIKYAIYLIITYFKNITIDNKIAKLIFF